MSDNANQFLPSEPIDDLKSHAERCRRLARATYDRVTADMLDRMAENYERRASPDTPALD
jgi:hypothetical protein